MNCNIIFFDCQGGVYELPRMPLVWEHAFWEDDILWCLFDSDFMTLDALKCLPRERINFVVSTPPRIELYHYFKKPAEPQVFYMPLWTEAELETVAFCFPHAADWRDRFRILGGVPRYVLEGTRSEPMALLKNTLDCCDLKDCTSLVTLNSSIKHEYKDLYFLVHTTSSPPFDRGHHSVCYASDAALETIIMNKGYAIKSEFQMLLSSYEWNPLSAALCDSVFGSHAIALLEKGGNFISYRLEHENTGTKLKETVLTIPPSEKEVSGEIRLHHIIDQLYIPETKNSTAVDAWIPGIGAFQVAAGKDNGLRYGIGNELAMLGPRANKLYWLVPPRHYTSFTKKAPLDIDQFVVRIPYPSVEHW